MNKLEATIYRRVLSTSRNKIPQPRRAALRECTVAAGAKHAQRDGASVLPLTDGG